MTTEVQEELANVLHFGSFLLDTSSTTERDLKNVLVRRLTQYHQAFGSSAPSLDTAEDAQLETAQCALHVIERVQSLLNLPDLHHEDDLKSAPAIGTRDLSTLRTLISLFFRWGTETLYTRLIPSLSSKPIPGTPKIIDLTNTPADYATLSDLLLRLMGLLFPNGPKSTPPQTLISSTLLSRHAVDLLRPSMALGWLPSEPVEPLRPLVLRFLVFIPLPQLMTTLATVLSTPTSPTPPHVRKLCSSLLTQHLLRPGGVGALCAAIFGELDSEDEPEFDKLEHVARVLGTVPRGMQPKHYFQTITSRILALVSPPSSTSTSVTPPAFKRAAAFTLSRMLDSSFAHHALVASVALPILHNPLFKVSDETSHDQRESGQSHLLPTPSSSLQTLHTLLLSIDPSPSLFTSLLSPILPSLYSLHAHLSKMGVADPILKEDVWTLMRTWGRVVEEGEGVRVLWSLVDENESSSGGWEGGSAEDLKRVRRVNREEKLALLTPEDLRHASVTEDTDIESLDLGLYPPPAHFVSYIKNLDRADIAGGMFVRLLEAYRTAKGSGSAHDTQDSDIKGEIQSILMDPKESDPLRVMLLLQLIIAFQSQLDNTAILSRPRDVLEFVRHALEVLDTPSSVPVSGMSDRGMNNERSKGLLREDLRIVPEEQDDLEIGPDSDDEDNEVEGEDMVETAVGLLLAVLKANPSLTPNNTPSLAPVLDFLKAHTPTRPSAREAQLVLTARMAEGALAALGSVPKNTKNKGKSNGQSEDDDTDPRETYQKALKLLQDPLLPVRAHGLLLLRELVSSPARASKAERERLEKEATIRALHPAILSIFLQAIQEDDSYVFLNAVQGLAALVHAPGPNSRSGTGHEVLKALLDAYARGANDFADDEAESDKKPKDGERGKARGKRMSEVDTRLRIGEALAVVVRRCGDALGLYADTLLPPLLSLLREPRAPVILRTSAISLLSECINTYARVVECYTEEIAEGMLDLVLVEMTVATPIPRPKAKVNEKRMETDTEVSTEQAKREPAPTSRSQPERLLDPLDISPLSPSSKVPALRRAALHFLALLMRVLTQEAYERGGGSWSGVRIKGIYGGQIGTYASYDGEPLPREFMRRARTVLEYIAAVDEDTVVRVMAREVGEGLEGLEKALVGL
ncbi:uncharacterized protein BJ212DRAFT_1338684 [Suillus subaureus]|uniref:RNA polymerase II assembly factor Rtp1 C-terminal domain-containing protein n=1 Tax=Suillus subaureus TaxID=48587 RepID=A0A9P7JFT0_9AGAM|nr:uncharacterized protein BJ212DRAFT_1338684 [Suillus subaureus]KAG1820217.1 hypothetical protein BJ212DRAFT_1338684 [Suillus subaureus]